MKLLLFLVLLPFSFSAQELVPEGSSTDDLTLINDYPNDQNQTKQFQRYDFKTAIVELERIVIQAGVEIYEFIRLFVDDHGAKEARYIEERRVIKMLNNKEDISKKHTTMTPEYLTSHTIGEKVAYRTPNMASAMMKNLTQNDAMDFSKGIEDAMGAKIIEVEDKTILGFLCKCREIKSEIGTLTSLTKECSYKSFIFESISDVMNSKITERVISFKENVPIPPEVWKFDVPIEDMKGMNFRN